jgi:hypothetical protein
MDLQNAFYIIGIVVMSLILILLIVLVAAVVVIRAKVNAIHESISQKLGVFGSIADKSQQTVEKVKQMVTKKS